MNERIKELWDKAKVKLDEDFSSGRKSINIPKSYDEMMQEKFAELIVKECMEQINKVEEKGDAHLGGGYFYDGTRLCRDAIKQHFGVEE